MEIELNKKRYFCCICGKKFLTNESRAPGEEKGTWRCIPCDDKLERKEVLMNKEPSYISFTQVWKDPLPGRIRFEIPFKNKSYIEPEVSYHVVIWRD